MKCDETRPVCHRCESTGRKCDGYQQIQSLRLSLLNSPKELRSYHYFWNKVLPLLPGHYDHAFWSTWIRQACFSDLAIQHALIAVGAIHESIITRFAADTWTATQLQLFAIQQYNKSIQLLSGNADHPRSIEFVLASCIVFITFENLYGRNAEAFKHLQSGLAILMSWQSRTHSELLVKEEYLAPIFTRGYGHTALSDTSRTFHDLQSARKRLQILLDSIYSAVSSAIISGDQQSFDSETHCAYNVLAEWYKTFAKVHIPLDLEGKRARILLRLQYETALILLAAITFKNECDADKYNKTFEAIVDQCEQLRALESTLVGNDETHPETFKYGFDLNILPALNLTALKCRDPVVRRRAIVLMSTNERCEGSWSGTTWARIGQKTMEVEEAGLSEVTTCTDIPQSRRVKLISISYNPGSQLDTSR